MFSQFFGLTQKFRTVVASALLLLPLMAIADQADPTYTFVHFVGSKIGPGSTDAVGAAARFWHPLGVATDAAGNVYVADQQNFIIRKITPSGAVTTIAGTAGLQGTANGTGAAARFMSPAGIAVDTNGNVYVADNSDDTIRKITPAGVVTTFAGISGSSGAVDGASTVATFAAPSGVAVDSAGNLYVADTGNQTIRKITSAGVVSTLAGAAGSSGFIDQTTNGARFNGPAGLAVDSGGNIYVADSNNFVIRKITSAGAVTTLAGNAGVSGAADGTGTAATFVTPADLTVDTLGNVYVADGAGDTIRKVTAAGVVTTIAGQAVVPGSADGVGTAATFFAPTGIALDSSGNIYVADARNNTIRKIASGNVVTTFAGTSTDVAASVDGVGTSARFNTPESVALDATGNVYVADYNNKTIRKVTPAGVVSTFVGTAGKAGHADGTGLAATFGGPISLAFDAAGNLYSSDVVGDTIRKITPAGVVTTIAGSANFFGSRDGNGSFAYFNAPEGLAVDSANNIYVADTGNNTIRKITPTGDVTTLAGLAGSTGSVDGKGAAARFFSPTGITIDTAGNLYVADSANSTIRKVTSDGDVTTIAGTAGKSATTDGVGAAARFSQPIGIAIDNTGTLFVTDGVSDSIRRVSSAGVVTTLSGVGSEDVDGVGTAAHFNFPAAISVDNATGTLYIADSANNDIRKGISGASGINTITVSSQPVSVTIAPGFNGVFSVSASSQFALTYQWQALAVGSTTWTNITDGASFSGSSSHILTVQNASVSMNGEQFRALISDGSQVTTTSTAVTLTVPNIPVTLPDGSARLSNISTRSYVTTGAGVQIVGFIIRGSAPQTVLIRANGPALQKSGIATGFLADPTLTLQSNDSTQAVIATNDNWGDNAAEKANVLAAVATTKAPAWDDGSKDAAIVATLNPGGYTAIVKGASGTSGIALVEGFVVDLNNATSKVINISTRSNVGTAIQVQIAGFIITGSSPKKVVIRANGPVLTKYSVPGALADPQIELRSNAAGQPIIATNDNWDATSQQATFQALGIDNWDIGSKDAAIITTLAPGGYTAIVSGVGGTSGIALVEVYDAD